jgi:glycosyltransferase involved in cell wall biosynthesis
MFKPDAALTKNRRNVYGARMRVLLSAYGCEPNRGGEPEIGWQRALHMLPYADEVWVLTRSNNQQVIEADPLGHTPGLHFIYYDLPQLFLTLKKQAWFLPVYLVLWQWGAYRVAAKHHRVRPFECVYHVTFSGTHAASLMGKLGIPLIMGPIGGGERAPLALRSSIPTLCKMKELIRDLRIVLHRYGPVTRSSLAAAERIYVTTPESFRLVPKKWHSKTEVQLSIATSIPAVQKPGGELSVNRRFVCFGRLLHWKGVHFAIRAIAEVRRTMPDATLTVFGTGPEGSWLRELTKRVGAEDAVEFIGHVPRRGQILESLHTYNAHIFPSLHDSGGLVALEALSAGLPVICLGLGGPGVIVNETCGVVIPVVGADEAKVVRGIASAMIHLGSISDAELRSLSRGAIARANELTWARLTEHVVRASGACSAPPSIIDRSHQPAATRLD